MVTILLKNLDNDPIYLFICAKLKASHVRRWNVVTLTSVTWQTPARGGTLQVSNHACMVAPKAKRERERERGRARAWFLLRIFLIF